VPTMGELKTAAHLEEIIALSQTQPVLVFKHSRTCPISQNAYAQVKRAQERGLLTLPVFCLVVQDARSIANEVARRWGIRHESPQVLLVYRDKVVYHASHWGIQPAEIQKQAERVNDHPPARTDENPHVQP